MKRYFLIVLCLFSAIGMSWADSKKANDKQTDPTMEYYKIINVLRLVNEMYVDTVNMHELVENTIVKSLEQLDPHSVYMSAEEAERANEPLEGSFEGIGIQYNMLRDTLHIVQVISGCPAERVGLHAGDRILKVDTTNIAGCKKQTRDIVKLLRGPKGSKVNIKVQRAGEKEIMDFTIVRDKIPIYSVDASYMAAPEIGYIKINSFGATTHDEFMEAWKKLLAKGANKLIIDLQDNGGGYLGTAASILDELLPKGRLLVYTQGEHQDRNDMKAMKHGSLEDIPVAVLVNQYSASASEITSGAVQDWDRGIIVGRRSFGKGLVQRAIPLIDGSQMRLTIARYYTPSGRCIQKPYSGADYGDEMGDRYTHGELYNRDSIHVNDSLKTQTLISKRTVYGGGGIIPDIFVPLDTTLNYSYWNRLVGKNIINSMVAEYIEQNRDQLKKDYPTFEEYRKSFVVPEAMLDTLQMRGDREKVKRDSIHWEPFKPEATRILRALIARDLWTMQEYYEIDNETDPILREAVTVLQDKKRYDSLLGKKK